MGKKMDRWEWLDYGVKNGFCQNLVCETHDGVDLTEEEDAIFEDGGDPCITVTRLLGY